MRGYLLMTKQYTSWMLFSMDNYLSLGRAYYFDNWFLGRMKGAGKM